MERDEELAHRLQLLFAATAEEPVEEPEEVTEVPEREMTKVPEPVDVKEEVKEEEMEATAWWEPQDGEDWYWEGVEEEVQEEEEPADDVEWVTWPPKPPKPIMPKAMPTSSPKCPPPPPPPPPADDTPAAGRRDKTWVKDVKAPWAWGGDRVVRTDKYGGKIFKSGWYQARSGDWWPILGAASDSF